jgi:hypothetical protein
MKDEINDGRLAVQQGADDDETTNWLAMVDSARIRYRGDATGLSRLFGEWQ